VSAAPSLSTVHLGREGLYQYRDELLDVYGEIYKSSIQDSFFSIPRYWERLESYASRDGFSIVTGRIDGALIGYALGFALPSGSGWWRGLKTSVDPALLEEDGTRTFAIAEIMVLAQWRRRGYARQMHDSLIDHRPEARATLLVLPDNVPARSAYLTWGWYKLGDLRPFDDAPLYDAMVLDIKSPAK
jgi:GNAT superfamily N-acetyltransferase